MSKMLDSVVHSFTSIAEMKGEIIEDCSLCFQSVENATQEVELNEAFRIPIMDPDSNCMRALRFFLYCSVNGAVSPYYSKSCAIVQSSGSGKSRTIMELAEMLPVIYICERDKGDTGYPRTSVKVVEKLGNVHPEANSLHLCDLYIYLRCVAFYDTAIKFAAALKGLVSLYRYVSKSYEIGH